MTASADTVPTTRITEAYARLVARDAYFWAWPLVNVYNRRVFYSKVTETVRSGPLLVAPLNRLGMLTDYIPPGERVLACPNQDVVSGIGAAALDQTPVVLQVPDFGSRFWVYQVADLRTDACAELGTMYGTRRGFYLLVGPGWKGQVPRGITDIFRISTATAMVLPRVFQDDTAHDRQAIQPVLRQIGMYPLAEYDGSMKEIDWRRMKTLPTPVGSGEEESRWVFPETFFDQLPDVLRDAPPLPGEAARYAEALAVVQAAEHDTTLRQALIEEADQAEEHLISPLLQFRNFGLPLPFNWTTIANGATFGTDYFTRTAVARSNIFVDKPLETKCFYQDLDAMGARLNGLKRYAVTFPPGQLPPVKGFWSLTLYNRHHFFAPNEIGRCSVGTKNKDLRVAADGSLTIHVQAYAPPDPAERANWLPAPRGEDFSLYVRACWPDLPITTGQWTPPAVLALN